MSIHLLRTYNKIQRAWVSACGEPCDTNNHLQLSLPVDCPECLRQMSRIERANNMDAQADAINRQRMTQDIDIERAA